MVQKICALAVLTVRKHRPEGTESLRMSALYREKERHFYENESFQLHCRTISGPRDLPGIYRDWRRRHAFK